jgi:hypothetical protein
MALKVKGKKKGLGAQVSEALENDKNKKKTKGKKEKPEGKGKKGKLTVIPPVPEMTATERKELAVAHDEKFRSLETATRKNFVEMMVILREMKTLALWKELKHNGKGFSSFDSWLKDAAPYSRASGYAALKAADKLLPFIPKEELAEMPRRNIDLLTKVPKMHYEKVDSPIRKAAKGSESEMRTAIQNHSPESHVDSQSTIRLDSPAKDICDEAIQAAKILNDCKTEGEALETVCLEYLQQLCQDERFQGMTNQRAAEALRKQREAESDLEKAV